MKTYRRNTKSWKIAELAAAGLSKPQAYSELRELVTNQVPPMVFKANVNGRRVPKPISEQYDELRYAIGRVYKEVGKSHSDDFDAPEIETPEEELPEAEIENLPPSDDSEIEDESDEDEPETDTRPVAKAKHKVEEEMAKFRRRIRELRKFCSDRAEMAEAIDSISLRPSEAAVKLIPLGVPADALLDSVTMHWPKDVRDEAGISAFNFAELSRKVMADRGIPDGQYHELFGYALLIAEARVPLMFIGPFGTGKSYLAKQVAEYLELPYSETPMSPGATRGDLLGRHTLQGFITSEFVERYSQGGVFNFEEIDASDPSMLIVLNNALASTELYNSANGEVYEKHPDFIPVSTANTFGLGADRNYTGRERLDAATIDRWRTGRIFLAFDEKVEDEIFSSAEKS